MLGEMVTVHLCLHVQMGEMVTVQKNGESESKLSVKSSDMIAKEHFPLLARFAYGRTQPRLTDFSKLLTLLDSFQVWRDGDRGGGGGGERKRRDRDGGWEGGVGDFPLLTRFAYGRTQPRLTDFSKLLALLYSFEV